MIRVGAATETEMKEKKARVEDALNATRAAVEEGIVPGGGVALVRALTAVGADHGLSEERGGRRGDRPARLRGTAAVRSRSTPADGSRRSSSTGCARRRAAFGYNAATDKFEDLVEAGVIDPTKVVRSALQNAASVAALLVTTEALIVERPREEAPAPAAAGAAAWAGWVAWAAWAA